MKPVVYLPIGEIREIRGHPDGEIREIRGYPGGRWNPWLYTNPEPLRPV